MHLALLTPFSALAALLALIPLGAFFRLGRRDAAVRRGLSLPPAPLAGRLATALAIAAVAALIGAAAAQPVIQHSTTHHERTDAAAYVVFDISRSMLASERLPTHCCKANAASPACSSFSRRVSSLLRGSSWCST